MKVAVIGATGTAGSRVVRRLEAEDVPVVEVSRSRGVDLISGEGLADALVGVDAAVDASNAFPTDESMELGEALTSATRHVVDACARQGVSRLVFLSILGVENPVFDNFPYYVAKRKQEEIVGNSDLDATILKTSQWHEFATNPAAVTFRDDEVLVQDWLVQPVAADTVADVLVREATSPSSGASCPSPDPRRSACPNSPGGCSRCSGIGGPCVPPNRPSRRCRTAFCWLPRTPRSWVRTSIPGSEASSSPEACASFLPYSAAAARCAILGLV